MKITKKERMSLVEALKEKVPGFSLKVAHIYKLLEWKWATGKKDELLIPSVLEIRRTLYRFLDYVEGHEITRYTGGGLGIELEKNQDKSVNAYLFFRLDEICIPRNGVTYQGIL